MRSISHQRRVLLVFCTSTHRVMIRRYVYTKHCVQRNNLIIYIHDWIIDVNIVNIYEKGHRTYEYITRTVQ